MSKKDDLAQIKVDLAHVVEFVNRMTPILPGLTMLAHAAGNLDRIGPLIEPMMSLAARIQVLDQLGDAFRRFSDENHIVSESVRVDVETISALAAQIELFNRQLLEQLERALGRD